MVKRSHGTFSSYTRKLKSKKKLGVTQIFRQFADGDRVVISLKPGHPGMPHPRYRGRHGVVVGKQGSSYLVEVRDGNAKKVLISKPMHLEKV